MGGIYGFAVEMGSGAVMYITTLVKTGSGIQKLVGGHTHRDRQTGRGYHKPAFIFLEKGK
jgi:hypothetical protein